MATGLKYSFDNGAARVDPNPWSGRGSALGINLGDPARVLTVARKHGLLPASIVQEMEEYAARKMPETGSIKMIKLLKEISTLKEEIRQLETVLHQIALDRATADLTHIDQLELRLARVNRLQTHLSDAVNGKDAILAQLQTRVVQNSIKVEALYQKNVHGVLTSLGESVSDLPSNLSALDHANQLQLDKTQLAEKLSQGEQLLSQCQSINHTAQRLHKVQKGN